MSWYKEVDDLPDLIYTNTAQENWLRKTKSIDWEHLSEGMTEIAQYFVSAQVLFDENMYHQIRIQDKGILKIVQDHLMPHYKKIRGFYQEDRLAEVRLSDLKATSRQKYLELLEQRDIHPFVHGLRGERKHDVSNWLSAPEPMKWVKLNVDAIRGSSELVRDSFWDFLCATLSTDRRVVMFMPTMWVFENKLRYNTSIQYLSSVCEEVYLAVNQRDSTVRTIVAFSSQAND